MKRVLVVDDSPESRLLIGRIVREYAEVITAESAAAAIRVLEESPPDIALIDLVLPNSLMQGDSLAELFWRAGVPSVIVTSSPELAPTKGIPVVRKFEQVRDAVLRLLQIKPMRLHPQPSAA